MLLHVALARRCLGMWCEQRSKGFRFEAQGGNGDLLYTPYNGVATYS